MAAALTLGLRGHRVLILEAAPKVCFMEASNILEGINLLTDDCIAHGGWCWNPSVTEYAATL